MLDQPVKNPEFSLYGTLHLLTLSIVFSVLQHWNYIFKQVAALFSHLLLKRLQLLPTLHNLAEFSAVGYGG